MSRLYMLFLFLSLTFSTCTYKQDNVTTKDQLYRFLDTFEFKYEQACIDAGLAYWELYSKNVKTDILKVRQTFRSIFFDSVNKDVIEKWYAKSGSLADKPLTRRLELWSRLFLGASIYADSQISHMEHILLSVFLDSPLQFNGRKISPYELNNLLQKETKEANRKKIWLINSHLSEKINYDLVQLVKLRNELACKKAFSNYYSLSLYLQNIREDWLLQTLNDLEEKTRNKFREFIESSKKKLKIKKFNVWDFEIALNRWGTISDAYFSQDSLLKIMKQFHNSIGFSIDSLPIKVVIKNIPFENICLGIHIPNDSRLIINPIRGKHFYSLAFNKYAQALKYVHTEVEYPVFKGYCWIPGATSLAYLEGISQLNSEFIDDHEWIKTFTNANQDEIEKYLATKSFTDIYYLRRTLKNFFFEYEMYKDPDRDLAQLEREMYEKYLLVELPKDISHTYASLFKYAFHPCSYQDYILAQMISAQVFEVLVSKFGDGRISNPEVSKWIITSLYQNGEREDWPNRIRNITGKSLETGAYLRKLKLVN